MDGGLSGSGWLSLVSTWVCVWCSTKRTQTKVSVATRFHLIGWYSRSLFLFFFFCFFSFLLISSLFFLGNYRRKFNRLVSIASQTALIPRDFYDCIQQ
jgi:hypothetical protein